jgi:hypothetical protein
VFWRQRGAGLVYTAPWGNGTCELRLNQTQPGVFLGRHGPLLGLAGLARHNLWAVTALCPDAIVRVEERLGRLEATYQPAGWHELTIRLAWYQPDQDVRAMELEVEILTRSVGELMGVEVMTIHTLGRAPSWDRPHAQFARDARRLTLSRDGREPRHIPVNSLLEEPPREPIGLLGADPEGGEDRASLAVVAHPLDVSRWIEDESGTCRIALFGHDLERGVVVRGRLRAWRLGKEAASWSEPELSQAVTAFLAEPPPLTT